MRPLWAVEAASGEYLGTVEAACSFSALCMALAKGYAGSLRVSRVHDAARSAADERLSRARGLDA
jgi:hypothetical protein